MTEVPNLSQVVHVLQDLYPLRYAEDWDAPGLVVGDLRAPVRVIHCAVDPTLDVVDEAISMGADLLITHHPLFFRAVHEVSGLDFRGEIVRRLIEHHCALWVGHTNADSAYRGVADSAATAFGLEELRPLVPIEDTNSSHQVGLGRVGVMPGSKTLGDVARRVAEVLPATQLGIQVSGDLDAVVHTVAVLPGSGDSLFEEVRNSTADVYITSDLRHHPATDARQQALYEIEMRQAGIPLGGGASSSPALINTPHSAIEGLWFNNAPQDVANRIEASSGFRPRISVSSLNTDPWTMCIPGAAEERHSELS